MGVARKGGLDQRLDAYFATLRSSSLKQALKRGAANWQLYAAVTGSAMAMATNASAQIIASGVRNIAADPTASARTIRQYLSNSKNKSRNMQWMNAARLAMAAENSATLSAASQTGPPSISPGGVVPLYSSVYRSAGRMGIHLWN